MHISARLMLVTVLCFAVVAQAQDDRLVGHWKLNGDVRDSSDNDNHGKGRKVAFEDAGPDGTSGGSAVFDGIDSYAEVPNSDSLQLGTGEFSISLWAHTAEELDDVLGDLLSKYDPERRTGFNFSIQNAAGVVSAQSNYRHLHFGIDADHLDAGWTDCGRPGNNLFVFALCVYEGNLYAGTFEHGVDEAGHVYRYAGGSDWVDCGSPDPSNAIQALAVYDGHLYAGAGRYLARGSALPESPNEVPGGKVYRYEGDGRWTDCGKLANSQTGESFTVGGMAVYDGRLYAGVSKPPGRGLYRYEGGSSWTYCGNPGNRVTNPVVYNGKMYFCSLDGGGVTRYDGDSSWTDVGKPENVSQTYGFAVYRGDLYASSWPNGEVFRYGGEQSWVNCGRLGDEKEVMGMAVYNGQLYGGTLPLAEVYRYDGGTDWTNTGQLDRTPDVRYRRAWSMAVFDGKLYCGTLPSGHVYSIEAGKNVTYDHALPPGWVHLAAVRDKDRLRLYVDGTEVATSSTFKAADYDISNDRFLEIGFGTHDYFNGKLKDVRIYRRALGVKEVAELAAGEATGMEMPQRGLCAHRGASDTHPENTLAAFREAIDLGAHMIEFDVALSKDRKLVLMHDSTLDRTTDGTGKVKNSTLAELKELDAGDWKAEQFRNERIPTLDEALAIMPENIWLNVHLKGGAELAEKVARRIVHHERLHQAFLACNAEAAAAARRIEPSIKICNMDRQANSLQYANETIAMHADFIQLRGNGSADPDVTKLLRDHDVRINYFGTNDSDVLRGLFHAGVEFPLVDQLGNMLEVTDELGIERLQPVYRR